jgi:hypothetical protein
MAFKRYLASKDNTITNAFQQNLTVRGTGSNMGQSDVLETFYIYAQQSTTSEEKARILLEFPISDISTDRTNSLIPASGSVSFYLKMTNARHSTTLPRDYKLTVHAVSGAWEEGRGLDMEEYSDLTYDNTGSNWINANSEHTSATAKITAATPGSLNSSATFTLTNVAGTTTTYRINGGGAYGTQAGGAAGSTIDLFIGGAGTVAHIAEAVKKVINATTSGDMTATDDGTHVTVTQGTLGLGGNTISVDNSTGLASVGSFSGGSGPWATAGGDFYTDTSSSFDATFTVGDEDLEVDVTTLVEQWINSGGNVLGSKDNHGFMIKLSSSYENSTTDSYYTKKFFARSSEFFFRRPTLEARWDSARRDNRGNFSFASTLLPASENLMNLYMYNYYRGSLIDIAGSDSNLPSMALYYSSGSVPEGDARYFKNSSGTAVNTLNAVRVSKGVYVCTFSATSSVVTATYPYIVDVWSYSSQQVHTGSAITVSNHVFSNNNPDQSYVISMPNLKKGYSKNETERFRIYARKKGWSPNVYTTAKTKTPSLLIQSASYKVIRISDEKVVIPYNTGSDASTMLSYDSDGNYFDLNMGALEQGYTFGFQFAFYEDSVGSYREQPHIFKFRMLEEEL